jgi:hypothetical protein
MAFFSTGLAAVVFVIMAVAIVFLSFQVFDNSSQCKEARSVQQLRVQDAARLAIQSTTQQDDYYANENITRAKILLDSILGHYATPEAAEKAMKLPKGQLSQLRQRIDTQYQVMQDYLRQRTLEVNPSLAVQDEVMIQAANFEVKREPRKLRKARRHKPSR